MMRTMPLTAALLACLSTPLAAQGSRVPDPQPQEGPAPGAPPMDRGRNLAAKLAGLVAFADGACPDVRGDSVLLDAAVRRMGIDPADLAQGDLALVARSYVETYRKDVPENCKRAFSTFGPTSRLVPNLIVRR